MTDPACQSLGLNEMTQVKLLVQGTPTAGTGGKMGFIHITKNNGTTVNCLLSFKNTPLKLPD